MCDSKLALLLPYCICISRFTCASSFIIIMAPAPSFAAALNRGEWEAPPSPSTLCPCSEHGAHVNEVQQASSKLRLPGWLTDSLVANLSHRQAQPGPAPACLSSPEHLCAPVRLPARACLALPALSPFVLACRLATVAWLWLIITQSRTPPRGSGAFCTGTADVRSPMHRTYLPPATHNCSKQ